MSGRRARPTLVVERAHRPADGGWVAGVDEVGRGAWAGPLSVAVAVVPGDFRPPPAALADSKALSETVRETLWAPLGEWCAAWAVGHASPGECDRLRMASALVLATSRALSQIPASSWPAVVVLDGAVDFVTPACSGLGLREVEVPAVHTQVGADATCASVSAASVLAKVARDRIMRAEAEHFPPFDFDRNKGYPSPTHQRALAGYGLTVLHRRSWSFATRLPWQPGPMQPGPSQPGQMQPGPSQPGPMQPGPSQPGQMQPGPSQPGPMRPNAARTR